MRDRHHHHLHHHQHLNDDDDDERAREYAPVDVGAQGLEVALQDDAAAPDGGARRGLPHCRGSPQRRSF